jgi:hypothetical protein
VKLIAHDDLPDNVARMLNSEVCKTAPVVDFVARANNCEALQALRLAFQAINDRRSNEGKDWLSDSVFCLLEFDCERHAKNRTEQKRLESLQRRAAKALGVPARESSLPWLIYASAKITV